MIYKDRIFFSNYRFKLVDRVDSFRTVEKNWDF